MIASLIYNSDIAKIKKKLQSGNLTQTELELLRHEGWNEHKVQCAGKKVFENLGQELEMQNIGQVFFFQIDNGADNSPIGTKIKKWQQGTRSGMVDACILAHSIKRGDNKTWFCEFKRIGSEKEIKGNPESKSGMIKYKHFLKQSIVQERLRKLGYSVHLTNNTVYCKQIICKEIRDFLA